jgi:hypothetical protein
LIIYKDCPSRAGIFKKSFFLKEYPFCDENKEKGSEQPEYTSAIEKAHGKRSVFRLRAKLQACQNPPLLPPTPFTFFSKPGAFHMKFVII